MKIDLAALEAFGTKLAMAEIRRARIEQGKAKVANFAGPEQPPQRRGIHPGLAGLGVGGAAVAGGLHGYHRGMEDGFSSGHFIGRLDTSSSDNDLYRVFDKFRAARRAILDKDREHSHNLLHHPELAAEPEVDTVAQMKFDGVMLPKIDTEMLHRLPDPDSFG